MKAEAFVPRTVHVLSPGPSLLRTFAGRGDPDDDVVCVNRAAIQFACSTWACGDYPAIEATREQVIGRPALLLAGSSAEWLRNNQRAWPGQTIEFESLAGYLDPKHCGFDWTFTTALAAIVYAGSTGADLVRCYGMDWSGTRDFDGVEAGLNRSGARWKHEAKLFDEIKRALYLRGTIVERVI